MNNARRPIDTAVRDQFHNVLARQIMEISTDNRTGKMMMPNDEIIEALLGLLAFHINLQGNKSNEREAVAAVAGYSKRLTELVLGMRQKVSFIEKPGR